MLSDAAPISAIKLPVAGFRRQLTQGRVQIVPLLTNTVAIVLVETAWTMTASSQDCGIVHKAPAGAASASQSARFPQEIPLPFRVVSKCALREKKEEGPRFPGDLPSEI